MAVVVEESAAKITLPSGRMAAGASSAIILLGIVGPAAQVLVLES